jgi:extradiol dioxygenase family protein
MHKPFHLSLGVQSINESIDFFEKVMNSKVVHRDPGEAYVNIDFFGSQVTLKPIPDINPEMRELHFGVNLNLDEFNEISQHILNSKYDGILSEPKIVDEGTEIERRKMFIKCPTGYIFEIKGYRS